jgi:hypothetical protein
VDRRDLWLARALARLEVDVLVDEAWSAHVREQNEQARLEQQARQDEANRQELLATLAEMRCRGFSTR